ncbi:unnamed protein product, partial [Vitis vinifera]
MTARASEYIRTLHWGNLVMSTSIHERQAIEIAGIIFIIYFLLYFRELVCNNTFISILYFLLSMFSSN